MLVGRKCNTRCGMVGWRCHLSEAGSGELWDGRLESQEPPREQWWCRWCRAQLWDG